MRLSTKGKYGIYAMYYLAQHEGDGPQSLKSIADTGIPETYLEQLLGSLRRAGLVATVRGAMGGYQLAMPPEQISVGSIIDATEGPLNISECIGDESTCMRSGICRTRQMWEYLTGEINQLLQSITLRDMLNEEHSFGQDDTASESKE